jgi:predicted RNA binding protein YcfA (HicA-like mRNA interferase family)
MSHPNANEMPQTEAIVELSEEELTSVTGTGVNGMGKGSKSILDLKKQLADAGFTQQRAKTGSHSIWKHPSGTIISLNGRNGKEAEKGDFGRIQKALKAVEDLNEA